MKITENLPTSDEISDKFREIFSILEATFTSVTGGEQEKVSDSAAPDARDESDEYDIAAADTEQVPQIKDVKQKESSAKQFENVEQIIEDNSVVKKDATVEVPSLEEEENNDKSSL